MKARTVIACMLFMGGLAFQPVHAGVDDDRRERRGQREQQRQERREEQREQWREQRRENPRIDAGEAARRAQMRNGGGRVLDVNPMDQGYRVKLLKQGEVRTLLVPDGFEEGP